MASQQRRTLFYGKDRKVVGKQRGSCGALPGAGWVRRLGREKHLSLPEGRQQAARTCRGRCAKRRTGPAQWPPTRSCGSYGGAARPAPARRRAGRGGAPVQT